MILRPAAAILLLLLAAPGLSAAADPADTARRTGKIVIADFTLGLCRMCRQQKAILDETLPKYGDKVALQVVMVNKETAVVEKYNVSMIPSLLFFDGKGMLVGRFDGAVTPKAKIEKQLESMGTSR